MVINPIVGVYIPIIRIPIKGGMTGPSPIQGVDRPWRMSVPASQPQQVLRVATNMTEGNRQEAHPRRKAIPPKLWEKLGD